MTTLHTGLDMKNVQLKEAALLNLKDKIDGFFFHFCMNGDVKNTSN